MCTKYVGKPFPLIAPPNVPECRVDDSPPWTNTGVDYAGPIHVKKRNAISKESTEKVYLCLLTCASTRGVHLELVENCSAKQFLLAFCHFVGRRGPPRVIMSDNAKNFKTAAKGQRFGKDNQGLYKEGCWLSGNFDLRVGQSSCSCFVSLIFLIFFYLPLS